MDITIEGINKFSAKLLVGIVLVTWPVLANAERSLSADALGSDWLDYLNYYRGLAGLMAVVSNPDWDEGGWLHSRYMVKNDYVGHSENRGNSWYTVEGDTAAKSSNLVASYYGEVSDREAIDAWMQGPFHNIGMIDPQLQSVGFGSFREQDGGLQMGGALDVLRGLGDLPQSVIFPVYWPGNGASVPLTTFTSEYPDPLSSCNGFSSPAGIPIILQIGAGEMTPNVSSHSFTKENEALEHCVFDESTYTNPDGNARTLGRAILDARDAIVLMPREPLIPGANYAVTITANGRQYSWSFSVSLQTNQSLQLSGDEISDWPFTFR
jgi:hypothetical protein